MLELLISYGYFGMFLSGLVAGSVLPFNSEVVMGALRAAGLAPWPLIIYGTIGNVLGGLFNYWVGTFGRMDWIEKYLHVSQKSLDRAKRFMAGRGAWMAFFAFVPILGSALTVLLGMMKANFPVTVVAMTLGKLLRYVAVVFLVQLFV